jgi:hypothetical protein
MNFDRPILELDEIIIRSGLYYVNDRIEPVEEIPQVDNSLLDGVPDVLSTVDNNFENDEVPF